MIYFKKKLSVLFLLIIVFISCQNDENMATVDEKANEAIDNWMKADLEEIFSTKYFNYTVNNKKLLELAFIERASEIRFIPGVINDRLTIRIAAVDIESQRILGDLWVI